MNLTKFHIALRLTTLIFTLSICTLTLSQTKPFNLKVGSFRGSIQWEQSNDRNNWINVNNGSIDSLTVNPSKTTYYRAKIIEPGCNPIYSNLKAVFIDSSITLASKMIRGNVKLPEGASINMGELSVLSLVDEVKIKSDGTFDILVPDSINEKTLIVTNSAGDIILLGHFFNDQVEYTISSETAAIGLLILYPLLKPVTIQRKEELVELYKVQPEFDQFVRQIDTLSKTGSKLFSLANEALIASINVLIGKSYNTDRLKPHESQLFDLHPITITSSTPSSVTITNNGSFSYSAGIYKKDETSVSDSFLIAGSTLSQSAVLKQIVWSLVGPDAVETTRIFDLKAMGLLPGEYEIRLRNGLAFDGSKENKMAAKENVSELLSMLLADLISELLPGLSDFTDNECLLNGFKTYLSVIDINNFDKSIKEGPITFIKDYLAPIFRNFLQYVSTKEAYNCAKIKSNIFVDKLFKYLELVEKFTSYVSYIAEWSASDISVNACQFLSEDFKTYPCFRFKTITNVKPQTYTCDIVDLKIKAVEDEIYYPKTSNPVSKIDFKWKTEGESVFLPSNSGTVNGSTDGNGEAAISWKMPLGGAPQSKQSATAILLLNEKLLITKADFLTNSYDPKPEIKFTKGENQSGKVNSILKESVVISIVDLMDNLPMKLERFEINPEVTGGGEVVLQPQATPFTKEWKWKLGPIQGEQTLVVTATLKDCNWPITGNPFVFKATAISSPILTTSSISSIKYTTAVSGGTVTDDGGSQITERGICWSMSANPTLLNGTIIPGGSGTGTFTSNITGLEADKTYHVRAFAINQVDTAYGEDIAFTTLPATLPTLTTNDVTGIKIPFAISGGNINDDGGSPITSKGVCWIDITNHTVLPTIDLSTKTNDGPGSGAYSSQLNGLTGQFGQIYAVRAYATNSVGTAYGDEIRFFSHIFKITTDPVSSATMNSAVSGGKILDDGGHTVISRGICWASGKLPTITDNKTEEGSGEGSFKSTLTGLWVLQGYNIRAYAITADTTYYGDVVSVYIPHKFDHTFWEGYFTHTADNFSVKRPIDVCELVIAARSLCSVCNEDKLIFGINTNLPCFLPCGNPDVPSGVCCGSGSSLSGYINHDGAKAWFQEGDPSVFRVFNEDKIEWDEYWVDPFGGAPTLRAHYFLKRVP